MRVNSFFKYLFIYSVSYDIIKLHLIFACIDEKSHNTGGIIIMTVGENIRRIRQERGLTLKQLGEMVGVSEAYIRAYESGRRNPKLKSLEFPQKFIIYNSTIPMNIQNVVFVFTNTQNIWYFKMKTRNRKKK